MAKVSLRVLNFDTARFECVYPTCGGGCCKGSRPPVDPGESERIQTHLKKFLPLMRAAARRTVERSGYRTSRKKEGRFMLAVQDDYCVFYNEGCVLHKVGAAEGNKNKYKPSTCITFPVDEASEDGTWYVRQWGVRGEEWTELPCLDPKASKRKAEDTLGEEIAFIERVESGKERWREG